MPQKEQIPPEFFIRIDNPPLFRRTLLEASKESIDALKNYDRFRDIRARKIELVLKLKNIVKEITMLLDRLKSDLPTTEVRAKIKEKSNNSSKNRKNPTQLKKTAKK